MKRDGLYRSSWLVAVCWEKRDYCDPRSSRLNEAAVMVERKWQFKTKFRAKAFGWRGSRLAISRLKEAVSEIKAVTKSDPVAAGDGGSIVDGANLAGVSGYRHLLGSAWDGGRAYHKSCHLSLPGSHLSGAQSPSAAARPDRDPGVIRANGLPLQRTQASLISRSNAKPCTMRTLQRWLERHGISTARSPSLPPALRCCRHAFARGRRL